LARKLNDYKIYYNTHRVHRSLGGSTPRYAPAHPQNNNSAILYYIYILLIRGYLFMFILHSAP
jgi:hypothetical protein